MTTLLIKNAHIVTMDDKGTEIPNGGIFIRAGLIEKVGQEAELPNTADEILDLKNHVVVPGLVNTHHHAPSPPRRTRIFSIG
jgi:8-oxoguanine deaminase